MGALVMRPSIVMQGSARNQVGGLQSNKGVLWGVL